MEALVASGSNYFNMQTINEAAMEALVSSDSVGRTSFQWGGSISAIFLLILNRSIGRRSFFQTSLLVLYLFTSFPSVLFKLFRGDFGQWISFLAVAANLSFPNIFPAAGAGFPLFVITPDWIADGLRESIAGAILCIAVGVLLVIAEIRAIGGLRNCECDLYYFGFCLGIAVLFFFTVLYIWMGNW